MPLSCFSTIYSHSLQTNLLYADPQENATPRELSGSCNRGPLPSATRECTKCLLYNAPLLCGYKPLYESTKVFPALPLRNFHRGETWVFHQCQQGVPDDTNVTNGAVGESWLLLCQSSCQYHDLQDWPKYLDSPLDTFVFCLPMGKANWCLDNEFVPLLLNTISTEAIGSTAKKAISRVEWLRQAKGLQKFHESGICFLFNLKIVLPFLNYCIACLT